MANQMVRHLGGYPVTTCFARHVRGLNIGHTVLYMRNSQSQYTSKNTKRKDKSRIILSSVSTNLREMVLMNDRYQKSIYENRNCFEKLDTKEIKDALNKDTLSQLNDQEIISILGMITSISKSPVSMAMNNIALSETSKLHILRNIEQECIRRIPDCDMPTHLLLADMFFSCQFVAGDFLKTLMDYYANNWKQLSFIPTNVVQLLFYATNSRNCLVEHMIMFEEYFKEEIDSLTGKEISLICFSFFVNNTQILNNDLLSKMANTVLKDLESGALDINLLINVMKSFRHAGFDSLSFYQKLGDLCCIKEKLNESALRPTVIIAILHTYSSLRIAHPKLFEVYLHEFLQIKRDPSKKIRTKDLTRLLGSCVTLGVEVPDWLVMDLIRELSKPHQQREFPALSLEALHSLAILGVYAHHLYNIALTDGMTKRMTSKSDIHWNRLVLLDTCIGIASSNYTGCRLNREFLTSVPPSAVGKLGRQLKYRIGLGPLYLALRELHGAQHVKCHFLLTFSRVPDIELRLDAQGNSTNLEDEGEDDPSISQFLKELKDKMADVTPAGAKGEQSVLQSMLQEEEQPESVLPKNGELQIPAVTYMMPEKASTPRKIVIRVMGWNQYIRNLPILTGPHEMELNLLNKLGYEVIVISPNQALELQDMAVDNIQDFSKQLLSGHFDIKIDKTV